MLGTIIVALILGIIIGPLARLVLPGRQNISLPMTILLGALGALIGSWLVSALTGNETGFNFWALLAGVGVAAVLVAGYISMSGRNTRTDQRRI